MPTPSSRLAARLTLPAVLALALAGCGGGPPPATESESGAGARAAHQPAPSDAVLFGVELTGGTVVPEPVDTGATGSVTAVLRGDEITVSGEVAGLSSPVRGVSGADLVLAVELVEAAGGAEISFTGSWRLSDGQRAALLDAGMYVAVHTDDHPDGEVGGQLRRIDE